MALAQLVDAVRESLPHATRSRFALALAAALAPPADGHPTNPPDVPPGAIDARSRVMLETVDPSWSEPAEAALVEAVSQIGGAVLELVDCRTTICELRIWFDDPVDDHFVREAYREWRPWRSYFIGGATPADPRRYVLFVARDGYRLDGRPAPITDERPARPWCE